MDNHCIHTLVDQRASSQSLEPAVETYDASLSYGDLSAMSSKLSQYLVFLGIYPEAKVALMMEPSVSYVVSTVSVLKAGATFVPLDATQPTKRLAQLIKDIKPFIIITSVEVQDKARSLYDNILVVDQSPSSWQGIPLKTRTAPHANTSDAAYIIFTSGSTGLPKGVVIEHGAFSTSALARGKLTGLSLGSRVLQYAAHTFDVSIDEILTTLIHGGCVCIPPQADRLLLEPAINRLQVNHALLTPTSAKALDPDTVPSLKTLQLGGELLPDDLIRKWCSRVRLFNVYGPTEASVACIMSEKSQNDILGNVIGFPVGSVCRIVDPGDHNQLVAHGVVGELVIGGQILARGYLDDCVRTASSFIESPPWSSDGTTTRFYKTGDLAKIDHTGSVVILGRKDNQIKIRGQRINVEEIETALLATNLIHNSVIELPKKGPLANKLVAIISTASDALQCKHPPPLASHEQPLQASALTLDHHLKTRLYDALQDRLTNAMIPKTWIRMSSIPETTSGKVNRKEIRRWLERTDDSFLQSVTLSNVECTGSRDTTRRRIHPEYERILCKILGVKSALLKPHLSFIQNGGDSIAAIELCRLGREIGISFWINSVLSDNSLEKLFHTSKSRFQKTITHESQPGTPFPLSPVQRFFFDAVGNEHSSFTQHVTLQLKKVVSVAQLERMFDRLVSAHPMLRARFHCENGIWLQSIPERISGSYTVLHCHSIGSPAPKLMQPPVLSLTSDTVLHVRLWDLDNGSQQLQIIAHHLVVDLVSWRIILDDLSKVLRHEPLPTEGMSFQTWCALQDEYARTLDSKLVLPVPIAPDDCAYWHPSVVQEENKHLPIAPDDCAYWHPSVVQEENKHCMAETSTFSFDLSTLSSLLVGPLGNAQPVELMVGSFYTAFTKVFSDRETPTVFVESHGREPWHTGIDILQTVGWYTTAYPIHVPAQKAFDLKESTLHTMRARRSIPANGHPYWCHRFLQKCEPDERKKSASLEFVFNFAGQFQQLGQEDSPFRVMSTVGEETAEPEARRLSIFDIFISVEGDQLRFNIGFPSWIPQRDRVHRLTTVWQNVLDSASVCGKRPFLDPEPIDTLRELWHTCSRNDIDEVYWASDSQCHMLSSSSCNPSFYKVVGTWRLKHITKAHLADTNRVQDAWKRVVTNHRGLRTIFIPGDPERGFLAVIMKQSFPMVRNGGISDTSDTNGTSRPLGLQFNERSIYLPHRITFHTSNDGSTLFSLEISHTVIDATSRSILMNELLDSLVGIDLAPDDSHYHEYIENQAALYSLSPLFQSPSCIFPQDLPCSDSDESQLSTHVVELSQICTADMSLICSKHGITISSLLFLSWSLVLSNFTSSDNISFSYVASGRSMDVPGIERFVGLYVDLLVLNIEACESDSLLDLALRIQQMSAGSSLHQHSQIPACQNPRNGRFDGEVNTMVNIRNAGTDSLRLERHGFELSLDSFEDLWDYDLSVAFDIIPQASLGCSISYRETSISSKLAKDIVYLSNMDELMLDLEHYHVSLSTGFLPSSAPLSRLPQKYYEQWETLASSLPLRIRDGSLRHQVSLLPLLETNFLITDAEWQRAYVVLGFLANAFIFCQYPPSEKLPLNLAEPMMNVSCYLGLPRLPALEQINTLVSFTGSQEESAFFSVSVAIERHGSPLIEILLHAMAAAEAGNEKQLTAYLLEAMITIDSMTAILPQLYDRCSPSFFYNTLRPFLEGTQDLKSAGLPHGVFFETKNGGCYQKFRGPSNAQSSLFCFIDIVLGIQHNDNSFLREMRQYMPARHRDFLARVEVMANVRHFVSATSDASQLQDAYGGCLLALARFRQIHIQLVAKYIVIPSIARFPGPKMAALTLWYEFYYDVIKRGSYFRQIARMHDLYGPVVRINPFELHVNDPTFYPILYSSSTKKRDKWTWAAGMFGNDTSVFSTVPHDHHRVRRTALNPLFSRTAIKQLEPTIKSQMHELRRRLDSFCESGMVLDLGLAFTVFAADVISAYCFGEPFGLLQHPDFAPDWVETVSAPSELGHLIKQFPWALGLLRWVPHSLIAVISPAIARLYTIQETVDRLKGEGQTLIGAGTLTTANVLKHVAFHTLDNPDCLHALVAELEAEFPDPNDDISLSRLEKLPLLTAYIKEGLRLGYGVTHRLQLLADEPLHCRGTIIPPRTPVGMTSIFMHDDPTVFPHPRKFDPDRWLGGREHRRHLERCFVPFSKGTRMCLGMHLAWAEIYIVIATVFRSYSFQLHETDRSHIEMAHDFFDPAPKLDSKGLRVTCIAVALYRLFLHPLATFPGPFWWKVSIWPTVWQCARGKRHLDLLAAHRCYGPVVRIGPNMLSYNTGSAARSIYASRHANVRKSDFHLTVDASVSAPSLFSIVDREKHAFRRRVVSQAFTEKAMRDASEFYLKYSKVLFQVLHDNVGTGWAKVDIEDYATWWTADTMGDLCLGRSFNCLTEPTFRHAIPMMRNGLRYIYWAGHLPFRDLIDYVLAHPILSRYGGQSAVDNRNYFNFCEIAIQERIKEEQDACVSGVDEGTRRKDYIHYLLAAVDPATGKGLTSSELKSDASLLLAAGSDAMSNAIAGIMFYLARHDFARDRAAAEVSHQFASGEDIRQGPGLAACTYLEACILESMRMAPPVATSPLERVTVGSGIEIDGHWFPAGITVGVCFYALNFNETIHKDPYRFWPERWLSSEDGATNGFTAEDVQRSESNFFPFSAGHRQCPARTLASRNLKVFVAKMLWHFDLRPATNLTVDESSGEEGQTGLFSIEDALISIVHGPVLEFKARLGDNSSSS
ncbi:nonribosomal peptide synthase [Fusarium mexicanum]|uniref:Nonribosomal peptide synthase n=1 Tax=Fusarium mexicanum TaxID=751941 RepID=A0A8H5MVW3_9HYPO|nr:nonribosomal peptide synthase [Fusarium mexicanum]